LFAFTATGGASVVQQVTVSQTRQATITWASIAEADSYQVQIAWIGVNISHLNPTGIKATSYTTTTALAPGNYRVWVRAVKADGTFLGWSRPVDFNVTATNPLAPSQTDTEMLAVLTSELSPEAGTPAGNASEVMASQPEQNENYADADAVQPAPIFAAVVPELVSAPPQNFAEREDSLLIEQLAQACSNQEWWNIPANASA
jgi:hypothetical protein